LKITIDVPDILPVSFENPSPELMAFVKDFRDLCARITRQYRQIDGRYLFHAYVRWGGDTVVCTDSGEIKQINFWQESSREVRYDDDEDDEDFLLEDEFPKDTVAMYRDLPGNWVVARLCIDNWKGTAGDMFETLRSRDFESESEEPPRVQELMARILKHLEKLAHKVPARPNR
jgi:hypothetical protein